MLKIIRTTFVCLFLLALTCSGALAETPAGIVKATMNTSDSVQATANGYNGTFVTFTSGAIYWVKQNTPYAVNGIAMESSPGIRKSPPSIKWSTAEAALKGEIPASVPVYEVSTEKFMEWVNSGMTKRNAQPFKKETYFSYVLNNNGNLVGMITLTEIGGDIAKVHLEINQNPVQLRKNAFVSLVGLFMNSEDEEGMKKAVTTLSAAWKKPGTETNATFNGHKFVFIQKGNYRNITITPAG